MPLEPLDPDECQRLHELRQRAARAEEVAGTLSGQPHYSDCWCCCDDCGDLLARLSAWSRKVLGIPES